MSHDHEYAEGIKKPKSFSAAQIISETISSIMGIETRETVLGYIQRGGAPSAMDRILATQFGSYAVQLISKEKYGVMVCLKDHKTSYIPVKEVAGKTRLVPQDHHLIEEARKMDTCFGI